MTATGINYGGTLALALDLAGTPAIVTARLAAAMPCRTVTKLHMPSWRLVHYVRFPFDATPNEPRGWRRHAQVDRQR